MNEKPVYLEEKRKEGGKKNHLSHTEILRMNGGLHKQNMEKV